MIVLLNKKQLKEYDILGMESKDLVVNTNSHLAYFRTNNVDTCPLYYKCEVEDIDLHIPSNEIWYETLDATLLRDSYDPEKPLEPQQVFPDAVDNNTFIEHVIEDGMCKLRYQNPVVSITGPCICNNELCIGIYLPSTITSLNQKHIEGCYACTEGPFYANSNYQGMLMLPSSLKTIDGAAFWGLGSCTYQGVERAIIDLSYTHITEFNERTFCGCEGVTYIKFPRCTKKLGNEIFEGLGVEIPVIIDLSICEDIPEGYKAYDEEGELVSSSILGLMPPAYTSLAQKYAIIVADDMVNEFKAHDLWSPFASHIYTYSQYIDPYFNPF